MTLYKNFVGVLTDRLPPVSDGGKVPNLRDAHVDSMAVDTEESTTMDVDSENGKAKAR